MLPRVPKTAALAVAVGVAMAACTSSGAGSRSASGAAASSTPSARSTSTTSYRAGESHRQEYYRGHAEDFFQVLDLTASVSVPYKSFSGTLQTKEWTPLEPDVRDNKYYVQGIGEVKETTVKGPREELVLVDVKND